MKLEPFTPTGVHKLQPCECAVECIVVILLDRSVCGECCINAVSVLYQPLPDFFDKA